MPARGAAEHMICPRCGSNLAVNRRAQVHLEHFVLTGYDDETLEDRPGAGYWIYCRPAVSRKDDVVLCRLMARFLGQDGAHRLVIGRTGEILSWDAATAREGSVPSAGSPRLE